METRLFILHFTNTSEKTKKEEPVCPSTAKDVVFAVSQLLSLLHPVKDPSGGLLTPVRTSSPPPHGVFVHFDGRHSRALSSSSPSGNHRFVS